MKQARLFDQPPDSPSLHQRLAQFKKLHRIWTYNHTNSRDDYPWTALLVPDSVKDGGEIEYIAAMCRVADEGGWLVTGTGELSAVRTLCRNMEIKCDL